MDVPSSDPISQLSLPPGFRFYPTDEELLVQYLARKVAGHHFTLEVIGEIELYKYDPWDLPGKAMLAGEKEWYFFSPRDRKYPNGMRPNRVAGSGYWKATGTDKLISAEGRNVGIKKALVFYVGRAPKGSKTNWIMHEYRLLHHPRKNGSSRLDDWVLCRIYQKKASAQKTTSNASSGVSTRGGSSPSPSSSSQQVDGVLEALPEMEASFFAPPHTNSSVPDEGEADRKPVDLQRLSSGSFTWANLAAMSSLPQNLNQTQGMHDDNGGGNCFTFPSMGRPGGVEDEVQSGMRRNWGAGAPWTAPESRWSPTTLWGFPDSLDPSGFRQPGQLLGGFGLTME